eukprot:g15651.t1
MPNEDELKGIMKTYDEVGMSGAMGSMDGTHLEWTVCPYSERSSHIGKEGYPTVVYNVATIGKTTKENLDGDVTTTYPPLIMSSHVYTSENTLTEPDGDYAYGQMNIHFSQGSFSRTRVKELNPIDLGDFFGNIGGFWELLIVLWGLFFIASRADDAPKLKAREFIEPVKSIIRRRSLSVDSGTSGSVTEERPHWEAAYRGSNPTSNAVPPLPPRGGATMAGGTAAAVGFPIIAPMNGGSVDDHQRRQSNVVIVPNRLAHTGGLLLA